MFILVLNEFDIDACDISPSILKKSYIMELFFSSKLITV